MLVGRGSGAWREASVAEATLQARAHGGNVGGRAGPWNAKRPLAACAAGIGPQRDACRSQRECPPDAGFMSRACSRPKNGCMDRHVLAAGQCRTLHVRAGTTLTCTQGLLWLTFEPDARRMPGADRLASPQTTYVAPADGHVYLSPVRRCGHVAFEVLPAPRPGFAWRQAIGAVRRLLAPLDPPGA